MFTKTLLVGWSVAMAGLVGCGLAGSTHQKMDLQAEDFFDDPQVIALCEAIEANDLDEMKRLIDAGADVNATGKGNVTPLLWAFFDNKLERFKLLLEHGADPNVYVTSDIGSPRVVAAGETVTHMASETSFPGYFEAVFENGGDPNLVKKTKVLGRGRTPLHEVLSGPVSDKRDKIKMLADLGADLNHISTSKTPVMNAVAGRNYALALELLELGADHRIYRPRSNTRLIHVVLSEEYASVPTTLSDPDRHRLIKWLEDHGESAEEARTDIERWRSYMETSTTTSEYRRKLDTEIRARQRREAAEKKAAEEKVNPAENEVPGPAD